MVNSMTDDEKFQRIREIESILVPNIHRLGILYLSDVLQKIETLNDNNEAMQASPAALGYKRALNDVLFFINQYITDLLK